MANMCGLFALSRHDEAWRRRKGVRQDHIGPLFGRLAHCERSARSGSIEPPQVKGIEHPGTLEAPRGVCAVFTGSEDGACRELCVMRLISYMTRFVNQGAGARGDVGIATSVEWIEEPERKRDVLTAAERSVPQCAAGFGDPSPDSTDEPRHFRP